MISPLLELELIEKIYACMCGELPWTDFMSAFEVMLPNAKSNFYVTDGRSASGSFQLNTGFDEADIREFNRYYHALNPWNQFVTQARAGSGLITDRIKPRAETLRTEYYNDFMRPMGLESAVAVVLQNEDSRFFVFNTMSGSTEMNELSSAASLLERIAPHLRRAFRIYGQASLFGRSGAGDGAALLDEIGIGCVMVRPDGRASAINRSAEGVLESGADIYVNTIGKIAFRTRARQETLEAYLRTSAHNPLGGGGATCRFQTPAGADERSYTLARLSGESIANLLDGPCLIILIESDRETRVAAKLSRLAGRFRLTKAEQRVAAAIASGLSVEMIAEAHGVSSETVRSQLKSIYMKMNISGQRELLRCLL